MADFLDRIKGTIDKGLSTVNVKSKELIEKQKGKHRLSELKSEKKAAFENLGQMTYSMVLNSSVSDVDVISKITAPAGDGEHLLDTWEETVIKVLHGICEGSDKIILFENTDKEFKITAKAFFEEVNKLLPNAEQKGQNLQWLGRVLGKFALTSRKYTKRIHGERETVYVFNKATTASILKSIGGAGRKTGQAKMSGTQPSPEEIISICDRLRGLDAAISELEEQLSRLGGKN